MLLLAVILEVYTQFLIKESKMSDLSQQNIESSVIAENTSVSLDWGNGNKTPKRITAPAMQNIRSLPQVDKKKISLVRQQLVEGTYDINKRLDIVLDRLIESLIG
jgi:hypothetical protein